MPLYEYKCDQCGYEDTKFMPMTQCTACTATVPCPLCAGNFRRQISVPHTDLKLFNDPIEMHSIAMNHDDDINEFRRRAPDVDVSSDPGDENYGIPIARNRKQKLAALKASGFSETK